MKRLFTLPLLALALAPQLSAQDNPSFRLGVKVAPNFAWMRSDSKDLVSDGNRTGFTFGLLGDFSLNEGGTYFFSTGLLLNNIGGTFSSDASYDLNGATTLVKSTLDLKLRYMELPLTLKLRATSDGPLSFYGVLGTSLAFNIRARTDGSATSTVNGNSTTSSYENENVIDDIALFKAALVVGAGVEYKISTTSLFAGLTYNNAFTNALDGDAKTLTSNGDKSRLFADYLEISLGVFL